jgi:hypothetical protein
MMKNAMLQGVISLVMVSFQLFLVPGCHKETDQDRIKKIVNSLSKTYSDPQGFTYDTIKGLLLGYFFRHQKIHVYITNLDVTAGEGAGSAVFQAVLSGGNSTGSATDVLPETLGMYSFDAFFKKEDGEWRVNSARWNRVAENIP